MYMPPPSDRERNVGKAYFNQKNLDLQNDLEINHMMDPRHTTLQLEITEKGQVHIKFQKKGILLLFFFQKVSNIYIKHLKHSIYYIQC